MTRRIRWTYRPVKGEVDVTGSLQCRYCNHVETHTVRAKTPDAGYAPVNAKIARGLEAHERKAHR